MSHTKGHSTLIVCHERTVLLPDEDIKGIHITELCILDLRFRGELLPVKHQVDFLFTTDAILRAKGGDHL